MKKGGQVLDFTVVRLHPTVNAEGDAARYQEISRSGRRSVRNGQIVAVRYSRLRRRVLIGVSPNNLR